VRHILCLEFHDLFFPLLAPLLSSSAVSQERERERDREKERERERERKRKIERKKERERERDFAAPVSPVRLGSKKVPVSIHSAARRKVGAENFELR
jgi:hypothetical protein